MFVSRELPITYVRKQVGILSISAQENSQQFITPDGQTTCDDSMDPKRTPRKCSSATGGSTELVAAEGVTQQDPAAGNCCRAAGGVEKRENSVTLRVMRFPCRELPTETTYEPGSKTLWSESLECSKLVEVAWPKSVIADRQTRKTSKNSMAYSTAVGPSSAARKRTIRLKNVLINQAISVQVRLVFKPRTGARHVQSPCREIPVAIGRTAGIGGTTGRIGP